MKKGTNPAQILMIMNSIISENPNGILTSPCFKEKVVNKYNETYGVKSKETIIANMREDAMIHYQEELVLVKLPQDGNKVDILGVKVVDNIIKFVVSQQKGNNASFNSTSYQKTLEKLQSFIDNSLVEQYFHLIPENLNPNICGLNYEVEVIIGMTIACGDTKILDDERNIKLYSGSDYLEKMGIFSYDMIYMDNWIINQDRIKNHLYDAVSKCCDFDEVFNKCIEITYNGSK
jgi:hypothetical protein